MSKLGGIDDLEDDSEITLNEILVRLMEADEHLELKPHIVKPKDTTMIKVLADFLEEKYKGVSRILNLFYNTYLKLMVSYNREGRREITKAIAGLLESENITMGIGERLTTNLKK